MVLPRPLFLRRLQIASNLSLAFSIRSIGTSQFRAPEQPPVAPTLNPSSRPSRSTNAHLTNIRTSTLAERTAETPAASPSPAANAADLANQRGNLAPSSIFARHGKASSSSPKNSSQNEPAEDPALQRDLESLAPALDPRPTARRRWERKMLIRGIVTQNRLSKATWLSRTERSHTSRSDFIRTSMKKMQPLARQIAGKPIEEAIVQMRFSKKKNATKIREHLEFARDQAIVEKGMGLGKAEGTTGEAVVIRTKDDKRKLVTDRTGIYVDQAWVGKGTYGLKAEYRARGKTNLLHLPQTSITVLLKEEATLVREHREREERARRRRVWTALRDRPLSGQRSYYSW